MTKTTDITIKHILILTTLLFALPNMLYSAERLPGAACITRCPLSTGWRARGHVSPTPTLRAWSVQRPVRRDEIAANQGAEALANARGCQVEPELKSYIDDSAKNRLLIHSADITLFQKHLRSELEAIKKAAGLRSATGEARADIKI